jgi:CRP-like cAMP-binding protein
MASKKVAIEMLGNVPMLSEFSKRELTRLWDRMKVVDHSDGHQIVGEGQSGVAFHLILEGTVQVVRKSRKLMLGPGDFFGEMALIDAGPRTATVIAVGPVKTASISRSTFKSMMEAQPSAMWKLLVHTTQRLREEQSVTDSLTS